MTAEATTVAVTTNKAGFWVRFFAIFIDSVGVGIVSNIIAGLINSSSDPFDASRSSVQTLIGVLSSATSGRRRVAGRRSGCAC